ncbi:MAG: hypothetical protein GEU91_18260 [Rhizobiales bacterium]|nr:hypothetical protein [Hyphomicrobiales bacterium]
MAVDHIRYDLLAQQALRGVVRNVLTDAAKNGLPGEHHFYIAFDTQAQGVRMSARLREQYPQEMTIILQHQFWDLTVNNDGFEVGLSFGGISERLTVPFEAIKGFFDPSVQFGLQFEADREDAAEPAAALPNAPDKRVKKTVPRTPSDHPVLASSPPTTAPAAASGAVPAEAPPAGSGEVVRLDRFRKK